MSGEGGPIAATGHMPFDHRSVADVEAGSAAALPVAMVRFTVTGDVQFGLFGEGFRFLIVDERAPHDRVYELTSREPLAALGAIVPPGSTIGHCGDERHAATAAFIEAALDGKPHLTVVEGGQ